MMIKKKVVFICASKYDVLVQLSRIEEYKQKTDWQIVVVAAGYGAQQTCEEHGIPFKTTIDYLTTERHHRVFVEALRFAKEWYENHEIKKILSHRGVSLCEMMEYDFYTIFSGIFLDIEIYQGIFEAERPDKIVTIKRVMSVQAEQSVTTAIGGCDSYIISSLSDEKGIPVEWITLAEKDDKSIQKGKNNRILNMFMNFAKEKIRLVLFLDWHIEIRHGCQLLWHFCIHHWFDRYILRMFSQKKRKIVFAGGLRVADSIADHLKKDPSNGVICLKLPDSKQRPLTILPSIDLESFSTSKIDANVEGKRKIFLGILKNKKVLTYFENKFCYNGFNFLPFLRKKLEYVLGDYLLFMVSGMELIKEMNNQVGIDIFISTSDQNPIIRAMMKALQLEGKKTLVYLHGVDFYGSEVSEVAGKCLVPIVADKIATWGNASRDWFVSQGASADRIVATSCSDFDNYIRIMNYPKESIRRCLGIPSEKKVILYALMHDNRDARHPYVVETRDEIIQHLKDVIEEIANFPELYLIVRPHPGDRHPEEIEQLVQEKERTNIMFNPKFPLPYLLMASDILVTYTSSTALEAMIFDNKVIVYNPTGRPEVMTYVRERAAIRVVKKEDIIPTIFEVLKKDSLQADFDKKREEFVRYCAGSIDGNATRNIVKLIYQMIDV